MDPRRGEIQHPADVGRCNEMPGRPHDVGAQDAPFSKCPVCSGIRQSVRALGERPFCARILLSLDGAQPSDGLFRLLKRGACQVLVVQPQVGYGSKQESSLAYRLEQALLQALNIPGLLFSGEAGGQTFGAVYYTQVGRAALHRAR
jgi:hypothetical protein